MTFCWVSFGRGRKTRNRDRQYRSDESFQPYTTNSTCPNTTQPHPPEHQIWDAAAVQIPRIQTFSYVTVSDFLAFKTASRLLTSNFAKIVASQHTQPYLSHMNIHLGYLLKRQEGASRRQHTNPHFLKNHILCHHAIYPIFLSLLIA